MFCGCTFAKSIFLLIEKFKILLINKTVPWVLIFIFLLEKGLMVPQSDNVLTIEYMIIWNTGHTETKMWKSMAITRNCSIFWWTSLAITNSKYGIQLTFNKRFPSFGVPSWAKNAEHQENGAFLKRKRATYAKPICCSQWVNIGRQWNITTKHLWMQ